MNTLIVLSLVVLTALGFGLYYTYPVIKTWYTVYILQKRLTRLIQDFNDNKISKYEYVFELDCIDQDLRYVQKDKIETGRDC